MSREQQDLERGFRMTCAFDHAWERKPLAMAAARDAGLAELEREANAGLEAFDRAAARRRHPAGRGFGPPKPAAWTPAPDPAHERAHRSITRDVLSLIRKAFRP